MKVLVCGGREFDDWEMMNRHLTDVYMNLPEPTEMVIIQGGAKGADFLARVWAKFRHLPWGEYPADWKQFGKAAGPKRNQYMLDVGKPDIVVAFPGNTGTADMVRRAKKAGIRVIEIS